MYGAKRLFRCNVPVTREYGTGLTTQDACAAMVWEGDLEGHLKRHVAGGDIVWRDAEKNFTEQVATEDQKDAA